MLWRFRNRSFLPWMAVVGLVHCALAADPGGAVGIDLQGKIIDPFRQAAGRPFVLVFVRTDCPISNRYAPTIETLQAEYAGRVDFWLVYPDKDETADNITRHMRQYGYTFPALRDPKHGLVAISHAQMTPEVGVFDRSGKLVYHGRIDDWYVTFGRARARPTTHELQDAVEAALGGKQPAVAAVSGVGCYISDLE